MAKDKNTSSEEMDFGPDYVTLTNDDGYEETFELVDQIDAEGKTYVALLTASEDPEEYLNSDGRLIIMRIVEENGEEMLYTVDDDDEYDMISDLFVSRLADLYEIGDDDEE